MQYKQETQKTKHAQLHTSSTRIVHCSCVMPRLAQELSGQCGVHQLWPVTTL